MLGLIAKIIIAVLGLGLMIFGAKIGIDEDNKNRPEKIGLGTLMFVAGIAILIGLAIYRNRILSL